MKILNGVDLVFLPRFEKLLDDPAFVERVFSERELVDQRVEHLAGLFAVKEAFFKATQIEIKKWNEIEVLNDENGKPYIGQPQELPVQENSAFEKLESIDCSISHDGDYVVGSVAVLVV